ncbi:Major intrinsic protein [Macleaya cordata]|uniref:Major intrinsic protein n=1 Tax=Macleaya cordata TaxID=56857 RepID=A0A200Q3A2_MACCD|nr:Major intrinsic protein [Macleaya cordata]
MVGNGVTAVLVFTLDTLVISSYQTQTKTPNLLSFFFVFLTVTLLLLSTIPISGGHINPVITFSAALVGLISFSRATIYIVAQYACAVLGALALKAIISSSIGQTFSLGGCTLSVIGPGPNGPLRRIVFDVPQTKAHGPIVACSIIGFVVGLMAFVSMTVTTEKGYAGVGMNPARCIDPALVRGGHLWDGHWVFWVGPIIACLAFYLFPKIIPRQHFHASIV